jgi:anaerobic magnesium-protoporphyrin IX monomethyl ester cyclase
MDDDSVQPDFVLGFAGFGGSLRPVSRTSENRAFLALRVAYTCRMRIALVGAEFEENLAVRYIAAALEAEGHDVRRIVFNGSRDLAQACRELVESHAELAGLSMVFTQRARQFAELATEARSLGFGGHLTAGGHFAAFNAEALLRDVPAIDSVAVGEGETICCSLAQSLSDLAAVRGLVWRSRFGLVRNPPASKPSDLDALPIPPRKVPFDDYLGIPITNILSSRGCAHACDFCSIAAWHRLCGGERVRLRSAGNLAAEIERLYADGARIFNFHDDSFVLRDPGTFRARSAELARELSLRGIRGIAFAIKSRPDAVNLDSFVPLRKIGLFRVFLGIEAGTETSLRNLGRHQTVADNERALRVLEELDLHAAFNLLLLNPDSTLEDLQGNVAFLRRNPRHPINFCRAEVYAGTPLERRLRAEGRLLGDYWGWDYVIADPRAQRAFEAIAVCFQDRNHSDDGLHHVAMALDYEHQLLGHFFSTTESIRRQVKRFIIEVNLNTVAHLEAIIDAVLRGQVTGSERDPFTIARKGLIDLDGQTLSARADEIFDQMRWRARSGSREPDVHGWRKAATAAGLAASVALSAGCERSPGITHPTEMVAPPASISRPLGPGLPSSAASGSAPPAETADHPIDEGAPTAPVPVRVPPTHYSERIARPPTHHTEYAPRPPKPTTDRPTYDNEVAPVWRSRNGDDK